MILEKLNLTPSVSHEKLVHFKQLLEVVFKSCFTQLKIEDKIKITQQFEELPGIFTKLKTILIISDLTEKRKKLKEVKAELMVQLSPKEQEDTTTEFMDMDDQILELQDESWHGCSKRCSLIHNINNLRVWGGFSVLAVLILGLKNLRLAPKEIFVRMFKFFYLSVLVVLIYETVLLKIPGAVLYGYRWYYDLKARDTQNIHRRIDHIITLHQEIVIKQGPTDGLIRKWQDQAMKVIVPPVS